MPVDYNIYCDESCHLERDGQGVMVLGAVWCPADKSAEAALRMKEIKRRYGLAKEFEIKWVKVSPGQRGFYLDLVDYFFDDDDLHFRALVVPDKSKLRHGEFEQTHDDWYYKMHFDMLKVILSPKDRHRIYLDIKDTRSAAKIARLREVLCHSVYDFSGRIIERVQTVRSHEVELLQMADLLIGCVSYANRRHEGSAAKLALVERVRERSGYSLTRSTLYRENKFNVFVWRASERSP